MKCGKVLFSYRDQGGLLYYSLKLLQGFESHGFEQILDLFKVLYPEETCLSNTSLGSNSDYY